VFTDAAYDWVQGYATISISGKEESLNDGPERVIDLLEAKVKNAEKSIKDMFGTQLYSDNDGTTVTTSGASANGFIGLQHVIAADRALGGITSVASPAAYQWWNANVSANAPALTYANMVLSSNAAYVHKIIRDMYGQCTVDNDVPTLIVTTQVVFDAYEETLAAQKRFGASSKSLADAGFQNLMYRGTPIVVDDHCPDGMMFFLNEKYLQFRHHRKRNFTFEGFQKPVNQDAAVAKILWLGALTCSNPSRQGIITGLASAYS